MKILFVCNEYPPSPHGGVGTFTKTLAHELAQSGHTISIVGMYDDVRTITTYIDNDVKVVKLPRSRSFKRSIIHTVRTSKIR